MNVGIYLRLSMADGDLEEKDKKESNSIENQRLLLQNYIMENPDLYGDVIEYVDDGFTGTNFNRPAFQQMIIDAKNGLIQVILVKDLSRLGRNYIEMGDYLDQIFPRLGVRVIAVSSRYDSDEHLGDVSGMDAAITNFVNAMYSRDLSLRIKTAHRAMIKNGNPIVSFLPYGYRKDPNDKKKWILDPEQAEVVRDIFRKASGGYYIREIVDYLNEKKIMLPGNRMQELYNVNPRTVVTDHEYLWDSDKVRTIIKNKVYIGAFVGHRTETSIYEFKKTRSIPKEDWVIIEDHHVAIVDKDTFNKAQSAIGQVGARDRKKKAEYTLKKKLRCGNCHLAFNYRQDKKLFYCNHKANAGKYSTCSGKCYSYPKSEKVVFQLLKRYLEDIKWLDTIARSAIEKIAPTYEEKKENYAERIEILKAERVRQYEGYAQGLISKDTYLCKKEKLTEEIAQLESEMKDINSKEHSDGALLKEIENTVKKAEYVISSPVLTQYMVDQFIKNVYVFDYNRIEIVYKTEDLIERTIRRNNEIMDALSIHKGDTEVSHHYDSQYVRILRENNLLEKHGGKK